MVTYGEPALLLEQGTGVSLETCSRGQTFVVGAGSCEVTWDRATCEVTWDPREGFGGGGSGESLFQLESVIKKLADVFNLVQRCQVLLKRMLFFSPNFRMEIVSMNGPTFPFHFWIFLEKWEVVFCERQS